MNGTTFEDALYDQIYQLQNWNAHHRAMVKVIENGGSENSWAMAHLEQAVRREFGLSAVEPVDWADAGLCKIKAKGLGPAGATAIDWAAILAFLVQYGPTFLAFLMSLFGKKS